MVHNSSDSRVPAEQLSSSAVELACQATTLSSHHPVKPPPCQATTLSSSPVKLACQARHIVRIFSTRLKAAPSAPPPPASWPSAPALGPGARQGFPVETCRGPP
jgi:hypothetical protein